jgi:hypothetical protein
VLVNGKSNNSNNSNSVTFNGSVSVTGNVTGGKVQSLVEGNIYNRVPI